MTNRPSAGATARRSALALTALLAATGALAQETFKVGIVSFLSGQAAESFGIPVRTPKTLRNDEEQAGFAALLFAIVPINVWYGSHIDPGLPGIACLLALALVPVFLRLRDLGGVARVHFQRGHAFACARIERLDLAGGDPSGAHVNEFTDWSHPAVRLRLWPVARSRS